MRTPLLKTSLLVICLILIQSRAFATFTFNWDGSSSTDWNTTANWTVTGTSPDGTAANYPGSNGRTSDIVQFGVTGSTYTNQPVLATNVTVASVTFGSIQYKSGAGSVLAGTTITGTILTVNAATLTVSGDITQNINANSSGSIFNDMRGTGTITCTNILFGINSNTYGSLSFLISEVANLNVNNNVAIHLNVKTQNGSGFRLENGTMTIGNQITFTNHSVTQQNSAYFTVNARTSYKDTPTFPNTKTTPTLILKSAAAIGTIPATVASCNFYGDHDSGGGGGGKATTIYQGASPIIYTTSFQGFGSGGGLTTSPTAPTYDNLIIQGSGTAVVGGGTNASYLTIDSTLTTSSNTTFASLSTATTIGVTGSTAALWTNNAAATITGGAGSTDINGSLTNAGTMNMGTGTLNISKDYTNTGTFTPNATPTITFDGTTQALTDKINGTNFYNVTFTGGGTKSMDKDSKFTVAPKYTLNVNSASTLAVANATATTSPLTILSTAAGDASIGDLSNGSITGSINVNRYVAGGTGKERRYMLLSSPVTNATANFLNASGVRIQNLIPLKANTFITGPNGSTNGFDNAPETGNSPSVFVYDENAPATTNPNQVLNNEYKPFASTSEGVPPGNGFLYYFRGDRSIANPYTKPFPPTISTILNFFGVVNKGTGVTNASLNTNIINFNPPPPTNYSASAVNLFTATSASVTTPTIKRGLNLVGNPYASAIDLKKVYSGNLNNFKFFYMLVKSANTGTNSAATKFVSYDASSSLPPSNGASQYALSGQGFFTFAVNGLASSLLFNETMKAPYTSYTAPSTPVFNVVPKNNIPLVKLAVDKQNSKALQLTNNASSATGNTDIADPMPRLRLELVKDTTVLNSSDINFDKNADSKFMPGQDAPYYQASGQGDIFYTFSSDSIGCFANYTTDLEKIKRINLGVEFSNYGVYKLTSPYKINIDERYAIFLKDKFTNDSLDMVHNPEYSFNVTTDKASYAHDRFYLSIGIAPGHEYKLLDFTGAKVTTGLQLNWRTDNESNFTRFMIEKSSDGGKSFTALDSLQSTGAGKYTIIDKAPGNGQLTYRLKQELVTGKTDISKNLVFNFLSNLIPKFIVYPSNATQNININFGKIYSDRISVSIISATGSLVKTITASNTDSVQQDVGNLLKGLYIVEATDEATGKRVGSAKFFKQ